jgi:hypothetical protein
MRSAGEERLYENVFDRFPDVEFIVDSSKDPFWITRQARRLRAAGIGVEHILIWKTPAELAASFRKRNRRGWAKAWMHYHRLYATLIPEFRAIPYAALASDPATLKPVCDYLGIEYVDGKHEFWTKEHHTLFGSPTAKIHTRARVGAEKTKAGDDTTANSRANRTVADSEYRTIYYHPAGGQPEEFMPRSRKAAAVIERIATHLERCDVRGAADEDIRPPSNLLLNPFVVFLARVKYALDRWRVRIRHQFPSVKSARRKRERARG